MFLQLTVQSGSKLSKNKSFFPSCVIFAQTGETFGLPKNELFCLLKNFFLDTSSPSSYVIVFFLGFYLSRTTEHNKSFSREYKFLTKYPWIKMTTVFCLEDDDVLCKYRE